MTDLRDSIAICIREVYGEYARIDGVDASTNRADAILALLGIDAASGAAQDRYPYVDLGPQRNQWAAMCAEIDYLRESYDALVSNSSAEHQRMSDLCQALSTNVTRLDEENVQQRHSIEYWMGCFERREDDYQRLYSQAEDIKEQYRDCASALEAERRHHAAASARVHDLECHALEIVEHSRERDAQVQVEQDAWRMTSQVIYLEQQRWQEMAEDLWEELQEWHAENCGQADDGTPDDRPCACHNLLAAKWDELTHAADYADDGEEA